MLPFFVFGISPFNSGLTSFLLNIIVPPSFLSSLHHVLSKMSHFKITSINYPLFPSLFPTDYCNYAVKEWLQELEAINFSSAIINVSVDSITQMKLKNHQGHKKSVIKLKVIPRLNPNRPINSPSPTPFNTYITTECIIDLDNDDAGSCSLFSPDDKECDSCALQQLVSSDLDTIDRVFLPATCSSRQTFEEYMKKCQNNYKLLCHIIHNSLMSLSQLTILLTTIHDILTKYNPLNSIVISTTILLVRS